MENTAGEMTVFIRVMERGSFRGIETYDAT